ncbi:MAG: hypothetical protein KF698_08220 [Anaerolineales bacterium]|nr:hypothetical protein [Anaerolineales bacterium]
MTKNLAKPIIPVAEADAFRASLRQEDQVLFDRLYAAASESYAMMGDVGLVIPLEKMLFAMLIQQQREIEELRRIADRVTNAGAQATHHPRSSR